MLVLRCEGMLNVARCSLIPILKHIASIKLVSETALLRVGGAAELLERPCFSICRTLLLSGEGARAIYFEFKKRTEWMHLVRYRARNAR